AVLHIRDRPQTHEGSTRGDAKGAELDDGGIDHAFWKPLFEAERHGERTAPAARNPDVLADAKDSGVRGHRFGDAFAKRFGNAEAACSTTLRALPVIPAKAGIQILF